MGYRDLVDVDFDGVEGVFVCINKCGGSSIRHILRRIEPRVLFPNKGRVKEEHYTLWEGIFTFSFARHPLSRFLSLHHMCVRDGWAITEPDDLIEVLVTDGDSPIGDAKTRAEVLYHGYPMCHPYYGVVYNRRIMVDFVGRVEHMADDWEVVKRRLNIERDLPHRNTTKGITEGDHRELSRVQRQILNDYYADDFKIFGYTKGT